MVAFPGREPPGRSREYRKAVCTVRTLPAPVTHACVAGDKNVRLLAQECCSKNLQAITRTPRVVGSIRSTGLLRTRPFFCPLRASLDVSNATYRTTQHTSRSSLCRGQTLLWFNFCPKFLADFVLHVLSNSRVCPRGETGNLHMSFPVRRHAPAQTLLSKHSVAIRASTCTFR